MKLTTLLFILALSLSAFSQTSFNSYSAVKEISENCKIRVEDSSAFSAGQPLLVIQMKGADINLTNNAAYGTVEKINEAGNYEINHIQQISGDTLILKYQLERNYNLNGLVQAVSFSGAPTFQLNSNHNTPVWNGKTGGITFIACDSLYLNANINATGAGFNGGKTTTYGVQCGVEDYRVSNASKNGGGKGESYVLSEDTSTFSLWYGRGAPASAGGGGNNHNTGGGGAGHFSNGGMGGKEFAFGSGACSPTKSTGGLGGASIDYSSVGNRLFPGSGGGGGHANNYPAEDQRPGPLGTAGGGIIIIKTYFLSSSGSKLLANGQDQDILTGRDGAGGAGAGGSIHLDYENFTGSLSVEIKGGKGGSVDNFNVPNICHGPGGGGSGGVLKINKSSLPSSISVDKNGGASGIIVNPTSNCYQTSYGASDGGEGGILLNQNLFLSSTPCGNFTPVNIGASNDYYEVYYDSAIHLTILENDTFPKNFTFSFHVLCDKGTAQWDPISGIVTFTSNEEKGFTDSLCYRICSSDGQVCSTAWVILNQKYEAPQINISVKAPNYSESLNVGESVFISRNDTCPECEISLLSNSELGNLRTENEGFFFYGYKTGVEIIPYSLCKNVKNTRICDSGQIEVTVLEQNLLVIPNAFSPNNDGINDQWIIENLDLYPNNKVTIVNRWGMTLYEAKPYGNDWQGVNQRMEPLPDGTYFYLLKTGSGEPIKGFLTIKR